MSRFFRSRYARLTPYTPGEQPRDMQYVKLNTNESPFPPAPGVQAAVNGAAGKLQLYCDPECTALRQKLAATYGLAPEQIMVTNGSDDVLNFAFMAFADEESPLVFPDITYGFYPVFAQLNNIPYRTIPLKEDFSIDPADYMGIHATVVIANPNAPTGMVMGLGDIEKILQTNPNNIVIVDEAYVDFGADSAVGLIGKYPNLLVSQTFSKSRSMAGARLGFVMGHKDLMKDLNTLRYSTNPYNVNRMTEAAGIAALEDPDYFHNNCATIAQNRAWTKEKLENLGFTVLPSCANFLFASHPDLEGGALYRELKRRGVLVRHFDKERISNFNRITIGTKAQMQILIDTIEAIMKEAAL